MSAPQYLFVFELDEEAMISTGYTEEDLFSLYKTEIPKTLECCGFMRMHDTMYRTNNTEGLLSVMGLQDQMSHNKNFAPYIKYSYIFRVTDWSDILVLINNKE